MIKYYTITIFLLVLISCSENSTDNNTQTDPPEYTQADGITGGILYDKFWSKEGGFDQTNPNIENFNKYSDFFRCKQCHAWDLSGRNGSYNGRGPKTNRPNVVDRNLALTAKNMTPQALFNAIKNGLGVPRRALTEDLSTYDPAKNNEKGDQMPDFSKILTDAQIWNIVKFLKTEAVDVTQLYDAEYTGSYPTGKASYKNIGKNGDPDKGLDFYNNKCLQCHGPNGDELLMENMGVGKFTRTKPYEVQHKVKFGQLGSNMGPTKVTIDDLKNLYKALSDTVKFKN